MGMVDWYLRKRLQKLAKSWGDELTRRLPEVIDAVDKALAEHDEPGKNRVDKK